MHASSPSHLPLGCHGRRCGQDLWLKLHSGESFENVQQEVVGLLIDYRSATLEILEDMMRQSQLESIADAFYRRKVWNNQWRLAICLPFENSLRIPCGGLKQQSNRALNRRMKSFAHKPQRKTAWAFAHSHFV